MPKRPPVHRMPFLKQGVRLAHEMPDDALPKRTERVYGTERWKKIRREALRLAGYRCRLCGVSVRGLGESRVDHIAPLTGAAGAGVRAGQSAGALRRLRCPPSPRERLCQGTRAADCRAPVGRRWPRRSRSCAGRLSAIRSGSGSMSRSRRRDCRSRRRSSRARRPRSIGASARLLAEMELTGEIDRHLLTRYAHAWATWLDAMKRVKATSPVVAIGRQAGEEPLSRTSPAMPRSR